MKTLIEKMALGAGISEDKAKEALTAITEHVKEQFPLLQSILHMMLDVKEPSTPKKNLTFTSFEEKPFSNN
jgi:hypothetical protein